MAPPEKPALTAIDPTFLQPCIGPQAIPAGDQSPAVVFPILKRNQANHKTCVVRHAGLVAAIEARDAIQGRQ